MHMLKFYISQLQSDKKSFERWSKLYELNKTNNTPFIPEKYGDMTCREFYLKTKMSRLSWISRSHALIRKELVQTPLM